MSKYPKVIEVDEVLTNQPILLEEILNKTGVAVIKLSDISKTLKESVIDKTKFYSTSNKIFNDTNQITEPTLSQKLNPSTMPILKAPDFAQGFCHQYGTPIHTLIQSSNILRQTLNNLYKRECKYAPNRLRLSRKYKLEDNSLHIEGLNIFEEIDGKIKLLRGEVACIVGLSGIRRFVYWDISDKDNLEPLYKLWKNKNAEFVKIDPAWMHKHYPNKRRIIEVDCNQEPMLIVWNESTPHEIVNSPALSCFISPIEEYTHDIIRNVTSFQPIEYKNLTQHESNLVGLCYQLPGSHWPSGKKAYSFCHTRAYSHYLPKVRPEFIENGKFRMKLISGNVDQHTDEYQQALKNRNIKLPEIVFKEETPNFVTNILDWPDSILSDYGFK